MTNQELKRTTFLKATKRREENKRKFYAREPERKLYDAGQIGWNEYLKLYKERKQKERELYINNKNYELYDAGLITYDEFLEINGGNENDL
ncbi:MAG: hypothetical protein Q4Q07_10780 [Tissierellia bacterium]|nr:hypothetical protein [Tissierellia bacterium]